MKANKNVRFGEDTSAQVGIGTLIIFIAMVLVAAVAAAVLIQTSGVLQQRAQQTGAEATQEVSSNIDIKNVEGFRAANGTGDDRNLSETIDLVRLQLGLQAGSAPVDINQVVVTITDGSQTNTLRYIDSDDIEGDYKENIEFIMGDNGSERFAVNDIRDEDDSFTQDNPVMNTGDLINMYIATASKKGAEYNMSIDGVKDGNLSDTELNLEPRTRVEIVLTPEAGALSQATFVTPSTYGVTDIVKLYP